jgi:drug/metabolite transporter (DMT)-like permease
LDDGYSHRHRGPGAARDARGEQAIPHSQTGRCPGRARDFAVPHDCLRCAGLKYVSVGRSIVLGYTTPPWVAPAAWLLLKEDLSARQLVGIMIGLTGLAMMFNPSAFDWTNRDAVLGNGLLLLSALAWSVSILYTRAHHWIATPFQLVFWQALLATILLTILALIIEGELDIVWSNTLIMWFAYSGLVGTALGFWAMTVVGRSIPATTTSLGILATPVVGIASSVAFLGEQVDQALLIAATMIIVGIGIGTFSRSS